MDLEHQMTDSEARRLVFGYLEETQTDHKVYEDLLAIYTGLIKAGRPRDVEYERYMKLHRYEMADEKHFE